MKMSDLVIYQRFDSGQFKITAERALDLAVDGDIPAFYKIDSPVTIHGPAVVGADGVKWAGMDYGKWGSITVQVPRGILFDLVLCPIRDTADWEGKPTALSVDCTLHDDLPEADSYLLWPLGTPIRFDRNNLLFRAEDLRRLSDAESPLDTKQKRTAAKIVAVLARMAGVDPDKPFGDDLKLETILADQSRKQIAKKIAVLVEMADLASVRPHVAFAAMASIANDEGLELPSENTCVPWLKASQNIN